MAENLDENAERAQFEQDVLKAAQDAMNLEAEANASASSATGEPAATEPQAATEAPVATESAQPVEQNLETENK